MWILSKTFKLCLVALPIGALITGADSSLMPALRTVVESERDFARTCLEHGIRGSFLQFFSDNSTIFAPSPTNGKAFYTNYQDKGRRLIWEPAFATISNSGNVGLTTGPWELRKSAADETPIAFGEFVSVWKKQPNAVWKVIVDVGIDHPKPTVSPGEVQLSLPPPAPGDESQLATPEELFAKALREDAGTALLDFASNEVRILRDQNLPAVGKEAARAMLNSDHGKMTRQVAGADHSPANDLAWRYGGYSSQVTGAADHGYYLTIWRFDRDGWKILLDLQKKAPPEKNKG
jgi:ketosteroid isomerase-like protein